MTPDTITTSDGRTVPLDGLEAVARAATPGPRRVGAPAFQCIIRHQPDGFGHGGPQCRYTFQGWGGHDRQVSRDMCYTEESESKDVPPPIVGMWDYEEGGAYDPADAIHIAHFDRDVCLALVAEAREARRLRECNEHQRQSLALYQGPHVTMTVEYADELEQERLRLRERVKELEATTKPKAWPWDYGH